MRERNLPLPTIKNMENNYYTLKHMYETNEGQFTVETKEAAFIAIASERKEGRGATYIGETYL